MSELAQALRAFADRIEAGQALPGAVPLECVIVLSDEKSTVNASYLGRRQPAHSVGIYLMAAGIQRMNVHTATALHAMPGSTQ